MRGAAPNGGFLDKKCTAIDQQEKTGKLALDFPRYHQYAGPVSMPCEDVLLYEQIENRRVRPEPLPAAHFFH